MHIYSPNPSLKTDKFQGRQIAASYNRYLLFDKIHYLNTVDTLDHLFSCFQFKMPDGKIGLIVRRPSQYTESAIDLFTWDIAQKRVVDVTNLADAFGDAGWYFVQDAWLKDVNNDKNPDFIIRRKDLDQDIDRPAIIRRKDSLFVYVNKGVAFEKSAIRLDTAQFPLKYWYNK